MTKKKRKMQYVLRHMKVEYAYLQACLRNSTSDMGVGND
jgi:hypothetical protein